MKDHVADLYSALVNGGYNVDDLGGSMDGFREAMSDSAMRKEFYDWVGRRGNFRLPDYDVYESALASTYDGLKSEVSPEEAKENADSINQFMENRDTLYSGIQDYNTGIISGAEQRRIDSAASEMEAQAEAARQRLQEDGTIDRMKEAKKEARQNKRKGFLDMFGSAPAQTSFLTSPEDRQRLAQISEENAQKSIAEYSQNKLLQEKLDVALDMARAGENQDGLRGVENFGLGLWDSATRLSTWDFGASDIVNNLTLQQIVEKWENDPSSLTATEQKVLEGIGMATAVQELYSDQVGIGYNVGQSLPESAGFMASMALNPASGLGKSLARNAVRTYGRNSITKNLARIGGDIAETAIMTATTGAGRVAADALERINGSSTYEIGENGVIMYGGQKDQETVGNAVIKAIGSNFIENYSEALGEYFDPLLGMSRKVAAGGLRKMNLNKWADALSDVQPSQMTASIRSLREKTKFGGIFGEVMEEEIGMALNAISGVGDYTFSKEKADKEGKQWIFDLENQLTTVLSCAIMSGTLNGVEQVSSVAARRRMEKNAKNAEQYASYRFHRDEFAPLREAIDQASPEGMVDVLRDVYMSQEYTVGQKRALAEYAVARLQLQYYNAADAKARRQVNKTQQELLDAQEAGLNAQLPQLFSIARAAQRAEDDLIDYDGDWNLVDIIRSSMNRPEEMERILGDLPPREAQLVTNYIYSRARMEGAYQGRSNRAEDYIDDFSYSLEPAVVTDAEGNRTITTAIMGDRSVYVLDNNGDLAHIMRPDGSKTLVKASELTNITTSSAEEVIDRYRDMYTFEYNAETENAFEHHPKTQAPQVGLQLQSPEGEVVITAINDNMVEIVPAVYKDGQVQPKEGAEPRTITVDDAYAWQDDYYLSIDADQAYANAMAEANNVSAETSENENTSTEGIEQSVSEEVADGQNIEIQPTEEVVESVAPTAPQTARERVPKDEDGNPIYEQTDADTAWDAIVEETEGNVEMAQSVAEQMLANKKAALDKLQKGKAKAGANVAQIIANEKKHQEAIVKAEADVKAWERIAQVNIIRQQKAELERAAAEKAEAEQRKAEEARILAEQEEQARIEREQLNGVPDMVDDTPQDARARGFRRVNGHKVDRQGSVPSLQGKEVGVKFANDMIANGRVAVIEAETLQPSHLQGQRNPAHFIDEAQPKGRNDEASVASARQIASNIRPEEITTSVTAYTGAPTVNMRGEAIQGNSRSDALRVMWAEHPDQAEKYKQYLIDHAEEFGLNAEDVAAMQHPVLVNMLDVNDADAINLGQYVAQDTESGGTERIKPKNVARKMGSDIRSYANILLRSSDEEASFSELVDRNGVEVLKWMNTKGYITPTQYASAFDSKGNLTAEAKNDLRGILYQSIFQGGNTQLEEQFNAMPAKAQKAILATAYRDYESPESERMVGEIQSSIRAYYALSHDRAFVDAKNYTEAKEAMLVWSRQYQMDDVTGESFLPSENFSNFALELAVRYKGNTQSATQNLFNELFDLIQGTKEASLFEEADNRPRTLAEAIKETLNIDYNGQNGSNALVGDDTSSQEGRQGSTGDSASGELSQNNESTADDRGRTAGDSDTRAEETGGVAEVENPSDGYILEEGEKDSIDKATISQLKNLQRTIKANLAIIDRIEKSGKMTEELVARRKRDTAWLKSIEDSLSRKEQIKAKNKWGVKSGNHPVPLRTVKKMFAEWNENADIQALFDRVLGTFEKLGVNITFEDNIGSGKTQGWFAIGENRVKLPTHMIYSNRLSNQSKASVMVHEMIHGVTQYVLYAAKLSEDSRRKLGINLSEGMITAAEQLNEIYDIIKKDKRFKGQYGIEDVHEMVSELAEPEFRALLKATTIWDRIVEAIRNILGLNVENNALDGVSKALDYIIDNYDADLYRKVSAKARRKATANVFDMAEDVLAERELQDRESRVYHGSGALFDKFDHSFVGTGEGNRAFGWGTYVSEAEGVGKTYAEIAAKPSLTYKGQEVSTDGYENPWRVIKDLYDMSRGKITQMRADAEKYGRLAEDDSPFKPIWGEIVAILKNARRGDIKVTPRRMLYEVEIPDDNGSNYLEWYDVVDRKNEIRNRLYERLAEGQSEAYKTKLKQELYDVFRFSDNNGRTLYKNISAYLGGDEAASQFLHEMGYVGIKYPTNTLHGGNIDGTSNYVIFNENDLEIVDNLRFREKEEPKELIAVHNISEDNLKKVLEAGSLIMPSIAITKADMGHTGFGEISLLFDKSTINPSDRRNKVYGGDAWTPRFPRIGVKLNDKVVSRINKKAYELIEDRRLREIFSLSSEVYPDNIEKVISDYGVEGYYNKEWMKLAYLLDSGKRVRIPTKAKDYGIASEDIVRLAKEKGLSVKEIYENYDFYRNNPDFVAQVKEARDEARLSSIPEEQRDEMRERMQSRPLSEAAFDSYIRGALEMENDLANGGLKEVVDRQALRDLIEKKVKTDNAEYNKWVDNLFEGIVEKRGIRNNRDWYTPSGNLRPWGQLYDPATPANILKYMLAENEQGGSGGFFDSNIMGASAETYESIEEIREKGKKRLKQLPYEEYDEWSNSIADRMAKICDDFLSPSQKNSAGGAIDAKIEITNAVAKDKAAKGIYKHMHREYPNFTMEHAKQVEEIVKEIQEFATGYFEAKPQRFVSVNEVRAAVVPSNASKEIVDALKSNGIEVITYKKGDEEARKRVVKRVSSSMDIKFREGEGAISDREVSYENDPIAKFQGKPRYYGKKAAAFAERERRRMENAAKEAAEMLGIEAEIVTDASTLKGRKAKAKGWYDIINKKVVVVVPNHVSMGDAVRTVLHEGVAHHGLRELFGDGFDAMLDNVYNNVAPELKARIDAIAERTGVSTQVATEEYLASLAETTNFEEAQRRGWWQQIKRFFVDMLNKLAMPGLNLKEELADNELRYLLWRSYKNLVEPNSYAKPLGFAEDVVKQKELKVGEYAEKATDTPMAAEMSEAEEWAAVTVQRIEELEAQAAQLENEIADMEAKRDADDASRYDMWNGLMMPLRMQLEDAYAEIEGLYTLSGEEEVNEEEREAEKQRQLYQKRIDNAYLKAVREGDWEEATDLFRQYVLSKAEDEGIVPMDYGVGYRGGAHSSIAKKVKEENPDAISEAAYQMSIRIPKGSILVPMPSRTGNATYTVKLAEAIAKATDSEVRDVLKGKARMSVYEAKQKGIKMTSEDLGMYTTEELPKGKNIVIIDNVIDKGTTALAAVSAVRGASVVAYAYTLGDKHRVATLKLAEPVTYDDNKRIIPLSQRFNKETDDIRYRLIDDQAEIDRESAALGVPVRIARSVDELPDADTRKRAEDGKLKGYFDARTGEVVLYAPNADDANDAKRTILHEIVGHKGLRQLIGEQRYDKAMLQLMYMLPADVRDAVLRRAERHGWNAAIAMDEYLADQAERDVQPTWWGKVNAKIRALLRNIGFDVKLTDADVTYLLWRSRKKLQGDSLNDMAVNAILKQAARKSAEAEAWNEQAFQDAEMRDFESNALPSIRHRMGADLNDYEKAVRTLGFKQAESWQDSMRSLLVFQEAIAKASGKDISDFENAYMYENRMSSANLMEMEQYRHMVYNPLLKEIHELEQMGASRESIINYLFAKSGLERNEVFARRDAKKHAEGDATKEQQLYDKYRQKDYAGLTALTRGDAQIAALVDDHSKKKTEYDRLEQNKKRGVTVSDADLKAAKKEMDDARKAMITAIEAEAQRMVDEFEAQHNTDNLWDKIRNCTHTTLNISHDAGVMSDDVYNELWNQFQYYIPLRGFAETTAEDVYLYLGGNDSPYNAPIKTAYGRTSLADDPIATIGNMAESAIVEANRNRLKQRFLYMVERHNTDLASISDVWLEYDDVNDEWHTVFAQIPDDATPSEAKRLQQEFEDRMKLLAEQNPGKYANASQQPNIPYRVVKKGDRQEHHVIVKRNGKDVVITINGNPRVAQAINGLTNPEQNQGMITRITSWINRNLSANFTMRNPAFMVSNFVRDGFYTNSMVWVKENPAYARQYNKNWAICTAQIASLVKRYKRYEKGDTSALDMNNDMDRMFYEFMINGGETGYTVIKSVEDYKGLISGEMKKMEAGAMGTARRVADTIGNVVDTFGRWSEDTSRFAAYMTSRQLGRTITKSIWDAKEISVNFNKKGSGNRMMGKFEQGNRLNYVLSNMSQLGRNLYVFWNAGMQGLNNFSKAAKKSPAKFTAMAGTYFTLGVIVAAAFSGDDDEDDYYNLPEYVRRNNICFKIGKGKYATLPLPIEIRGIYGLGELAYSYLSGREGLTHGEAVTKTIQQITQVMPIDMMADGGGAMALVPSAAKPVLEVIHNVDWTGRPIYKEKTPWNQNDPTWTLAFKSTSPELIGMSRLVNEWTNKNTADGLERPYNRGWADNRYLNNPAVWEHIAEGYLGGIATMALQAKKTLMMPFNEDLREVRNVPIVSRFVKDAGKEGRSYAARNEYYDAKNTMDSWKNEMSKAKKEVLDESLTDEQRLKAAKLRSSLEQQYMEAAERWKVLDRQRKALEEAYKNGQSEENRQALDDVMMQMATLVEVYK